MATVGDLKRQGKDGLRIRCPGCGWVVLKWWGLLPVPNETELDAIVAHLRCSRCRCRPEELDVQPCSQSDDYPSNFANFPKPGFNG